jgi:hypothetical protein
MPYSIVSNRKNTSVVLHFASSNSTVLVTGNNAVSNIALPGETITGAYITQAVWGCDPSGYITVKRGGTLVAAYDSTGQHEYAGCGMPINVGSDAANLQVDIIGSTNCFLIMELQKQGDLTANSEYFQV